MPIRTKLTTRGFEEYLERLANAGRDIDAIAADVLVAGGRVLAEGMQERAPKDTHNLENNIEVSEPQRDGNFTFVWVGLKKSADGNTHRYALAQEYGWADRQGAKAGQPYIRPTLDSDMGKARKAMRDVYEQEVKGL